jgi:hypothetical protein
LYIESDYLSFEELVDIVNVVINIRPSNNTDYYPPVLSNAFVFAYTAGYEFAQTLYARNGWAGLNGAWENLPQSTEHILHPDRYFAGDMPVTVTIPPLHGILGEGWQQMEEAVFGEFFLRQYLTQQLSLDEIGVATTGWGGDLFTLYWHEQSDDIVLVLRNVWDTSGDSNEFITAYGRYADLRFGSQRQVQPDGATCWQSIDYVCLYQAGGETLVVRAPTLEIAAAVAAEIYTQ